MNTEAPTNPDAFEHALNMIRLTEPAQVQTVPVATIAVQPTTNMVASTREPSLFPDQLPMQGAGAAGAAWFILIVWVSLVGWRMTRSVTTVAAAERDAAARKTAAGNACIKAGIVVR